MLFWYTYVLCCVYLIQSCPTLCNPMDCRPPGSSVHGLLQPRVLEWVDISSSKGSSRPWDRTSVSCISCTAGRFFTTEPQGKPRIPCNWFQKVQHINTETHFWHKGYESIFFSPLLSSFFFLKKKDNTMWFQNASPCLETNLPHHSAWSPNFLGWGSRPGWHSPSPTAPQHRPSASHRSLTAPPAASAQADYTMSPFDYEPPGCRNHVS